MTSTIINILAGIMLSSNIQNVSQSSTEENTQDVIFDNSYSAYAFIETKKIIGPVECLPSIAFNTCVENFAKFPKTESVSHGSGLFIKTKSKKAIITAYHVCGQSYAEGIYDNNGIKIKLSLKSEITVKNINGESFRAKVLNIDEENDLCALEVSDAYGTPVTFSLVPPKLGERVHYYGSPMGIFNRRQVFKFEGFFAGNKGKLSYYTVPTRPGSSGSIVLNESGEAIGILVLAFENMESVGAGVRYHILSKFLDSI